MTRTGISSVAAGVFLLGLIAGFFVPDFRESDDAIIEPDLTAWLRQENERLRQALQDLREELRAEQARSTELAAAVESRKEAPAPQPAPKPRRMRAGTTGLQLESIDQADAVFAEAVDVVDLETLWLLAAALLGMGEEGYEKLIALFARFEESIEDDELLKRHAQNEMYAGRFLRALLDHDENVLRFLLYLQGAEQESLPQSLKFVQDLATDDVGALLLGIYGGDAQDVHDGYAEIFRKALDEGKDPDAVEGLAQLRGDVATDVLLEYLQGGNVDDPPAVLRALGYQGNPRALPTLRALRSVIRDPKHLEALELTIRLLEWKASRAGATLPK